MRVPYVPGSEGRQHIAAGAAETECLDTERFSSRINNFSSKVNSSVRVSIVHTIQIGILGIDCALHKLEDALHWLDHRLLELSLRAGDWSL
jgi:hypothetical protein